MYEHKNKLVTGFTSKYSLGRLVYFEEFDSINDAIRREKQLKKWKMTWKLDLIEAINPTWRDLYECNSFQIVEDQLIWFPAFPAFA